MQKAARRLGTVLIVVGLLGVAWVITVWQWQDPFTGLYTTYEQGKLKGSLRREFEAFKPLPLPRQAKASRKALIAGEERVIAREAARLQKSSRIGQPIGRILVPRLGLNMVLVNGTDHDSLVKGPGRDPRTSMPGEGQLVYIAGHRTTYLAPFSKIDEMRRNDKITLQMPYATFVYRVTGYRIVTADDLAVLRSPGHEVVELQACHPRFFATHRYIVYALPLRVIPRVGRPYDPLAPSASRTADLQLARAAASTGLPITSTGNQSQTN